ncbi:hypothetical protein [Cysteiniphilum marinum]|nr:hypothetical protein [Cysteiniphilum marinum]
MQFLGHKLNQSPVFFGVINPLMLPPLAFIFFIGWRPFQIVMLFLIVLVFVLDRLDIKPNEIWRFVQIRWFRRSSVVYSSTPHAIKQRNLKEFGFYDEL